MATRAAPASPRDGRGGAHRKMNSGRDIQINFSFHRGVSAYQDFTTRLKLLISKNPHLITTTLSNIFTMRLVGNKTHGDLAEIAIAEFINQFMYDFKSLHVGKDLYRAKEHEEDITITNEITKATFPVSLKAYGDGPLQLSTDKHFQMFPKLKAIGTLIEKKADIARIWADPAFSEFSAMNVLPLIYDEKKQRCNILVFNSGAAKAGVARVAYEEVGRGRMHPVFMTRKGVIFARCVMEVEPPTRSNAAFGRIPKMG